MPAPQPGDVLFPPPGKARYSSEHPERDSSVAGRSKASASATVWDKSRIPVPNAALTAMLAPSVSAGEFAALHEELDKVQKDLLALTMFLGSQRNEASSEVDKSLQALSEIEVRERETTKRVIVLEDQIQRVIGDLETAIGEQLRSINDQQKVRNEEIGRIRADSLKLATAFAEMRQDFERLSVVKSEPAESDSFYAKTLGAILGQNIETLRAGNFDQMSQQLGERLNQFFQLEVPHGDALRSLRQRAEAIKIGLEEVVAQMVRLKPEAAADVSPHLKRAEALAIELASLQLQLQNRRATIETTLRVPVSIHAGARQSFLNELGRGIRREVDKLSDPQSHFAGELNRLIATDIVSVADVCDTLIAHPGARQELENALSRLFTQAGLRMILPRQGDPFKLAEHETVRAITNETGKSMTVAQVIRRGFYQVQNERETLLRRAGVVVYR